MPGVKRKLQLSNNPLTEIRQPKDQKSANNILDHVETQDQSIIKTRLVKIGKCKDDGIMLDRRYRLLSWNVNGIRAWVKHKCGLEFLMNQKERFDFICLQEIKCAGTKIPSEIVEFLNKYNYLGYFLHGDKEGYSGVATITRIPPKRVRVDIGLNEEGRIIVLEFDKFTLINSYVPNAGLGLKRLQYRLKWNEVFLNSIKTISLPILCGDLNVAHKPIDLKNPKNNEKTAGFTIEERKDFTSLLDKCNLIDTFRELYPDRKDAYTFWSYKRKSRENNVGWRLDYFLSRDSKDIKILDNIIHTLIKGSDHCPIELIIDFKTDLTAAK